MPVDAIMALITLKPTSPGRRFTVQVRHEGLHKGTPYRPLTTSKAANAGRNNNGRITVRHRGGGHKKRYRIIDFRRDKLNVPGRVERLEYDPNRTALIALVLYADGERRYILAPNELAVGDPVQASESSEIGIKPGNSMPLSAMPLGTLVHCVELKPGKGGQLARAAGTAVQVLARESGYATLRLRSGEMRKVPEMCRATIGELSNTEHNRRKLGKAGANRWRGRRPTVRGVAMNPVDHPHGGGEGKTSGGRHPVSPTGVPAKGFRTRTRKGSDRLIVRRRYAKK